jgi:hypothetical protein
MNRQALIVALSLFILQAQFVLPSPTTSTRLVSKKKKESPFSDDGLFGFTLLYLGQFF